LNYAIAQLCTPEQLATLKEQIVQFTSIKEQITDIKDPEYIKARDELGQLAAQIINLPAQDIRQSILPLELDVELMSLTAENNQKLSAVMEKYLIHYRSALTDTTVLGFPFHYFYSSVFLLVLFVGLCLLYCVRTDALHRKLQVDDDM
jgi:putative solute:sodium symporter small subunit